MTSPISPAAVGDQHGAGVRAPTLFDPEAPGAAPAPGENGVADVGTGEGSASVTLFIRNRQQVVVARTLVDADIAPALSVWSWCLDSDGYAVRAEALPGGKSRQLFLHRVVMCCWHGDQLEIDHINRDRLDNRRANLRFTTHLENMRNRSLTDASVCARGHDRAKHTVPTRTGRRCQACAQESRARRTLRERAAREGATQ